MADEMEMGDEAAAPGAHTTTCTMCGHSHQGDDTCDVDGCDCTGKDA